MTHYDVTIFPSLTDTYTHRTTGLDWTSLCSLMSVHVRLPPTKKLDAPGFGPYALTTPNDTCPPHKHPDRRPHRCDGSVRAVTLAVFDVDEGTPAEVEKCRSALNGVAQIWYSSFNHHPDAPRYRLVLPLTTPVPSSSWRGVRKVLLDRYAIPAKEVSSSGVSHFYFLPSCPVDATPYVLIVDGTPLTPPVAASTPRAVVRVRAYDPPPEPTEPVDLEPYRARVSARITNLRRSTDSKSKWKADVLERCLAGEALAEHGSRNVATSTTAGVLAYVSWGLPGYSLGTLYSLMAPSVSAMQAAGSSIEEVDVERMILSAMRSRWEANERDEGIRKALQRAALDYRIRKG